MKAEIPAEVFTRIRELEDMVLRLEGQVDSLTRRVKAMNQRSVDDLVAVVQPEPQKSYKIMRDLTHNEMHY